MLTIEKLRHGLSYDENTGQLTWLVGRRNGQIAGTLTKKGYIRLKIDKNYMAHRVAWALHYGKWPDKSIDHIDGNRTNNRINNLREATFSQNSINSKIRNDNIHGSKGISKIPYGWTSHIWLNKEKYYLGFFKTKSEAMAARSKAEIKYFGEWNYKGL